MPSARTASVGKNATSAAMPSAVAGSGTPPDRSGRPVRAEHGAAAEQGIGLVEDLDRSRARPAPRQRACRPRPRSCPPAAAIRRRGRCRRPGVGPGGTDRARRPNRGRGRDATKQTSVKCYEGGTYAASAPGDHVTRCHPLCHPDWPRRTTPGRPLVRLRRKELVRGRRGHRSTRRWPPTAPASRPAGHSGHPAPRGPCS